VPNEAGVKKHGWPKWDDVIFSHMTPFGWASTRRMSGAFLPGSSLEGVKNTFETAASARGRPGGFGMYEGGYPVGHHELDPSGSGSWPKVVVVGTDEWASPPAHKAAASGPVKEWCVYQLFAKAGVLLEQLSQCFRFTILVLYFFCSTSSSSTSHVVDMYDWLYCALQVLVEPQRVGPRAGRVLRSAYQGGKRPPWSSHGVAQGPPALPAGSLLPTGITISFSRMEWLRLKR
jgi:hypothetical protein